MHPSYDETERLWQAMLDVNQQLAEFRGKCQRSIALLGDLQRHQQWMDKLLEDSRECIDSSSAMLAELEALMADAEATENVMASAFKRLRL